MANSASSALEAFENFDFEASDEWNAYVSTLEAANNIALLRRKARWFQRNVDSALNIDDAMASHLSGGYKQSRFVVLTNILDAGQPTSEPQRVLDNTLPLQFPALLSPTLPPHHARTSDKMVVLKCTSGLKPQEEEEEEEEEEVPPPQHHRHLSRPYGRLYPPPAASNSCYNFATSYCVATVF